MDSITERGALAREQRTVAYPFELRDDGDGSVTFDGVASVVDEPYTVRDMFGEFTETMVKGAFAKTLKERDDVRLLVNHEGVPLARTKSGTLTLSARPDLRAVAKLDAASPLVQGIRSAMDRGDMDQMSIGMRVTRQEWNEDYTERFVREVQLFDVSLVTFPANTLTSASLRNLEETVRELTATDVDADMVRRTVDYLTALLPPDTQPEDVPAVHPELVAAAHAAARLARPDFVLPV